MQDKTTAAADTITRPAQPAASERSGDTVNAAKSGEARGSATSVASSAATGATNTAATGSGNRPAVKKRVLKIPSERFILTWVFRGLLAMSIAFLAVDYRTLYEEANAPLPGETEREEPVVMEPPQDDGGGDRVQPYLPKTTPIRRNGEGPQMPGYAKPPPHELMAKAMTFTRGPGGKASAVGRIEPGTSNRFAEFLESQGGEIKEMHLHSPGGSVQDALAMSALIRARDLTTVVPKNAYCASSCPIVFSGGATRIVGGSAWIGVHQIFAPPRTPGKLADGMSQGQAITARVQQHLVDMGVDSRAWIHAMQTPSDQLYVFTPKQLKDYKLATRFEKKG